MSNKFEIRNQFSRDITDTIFTKSPFFFSGGEPHFELCRRFICDGQTIVAYIVNSEGFMTLCTIVNAYKETGIKDLTLSIPYFPGGRQDRIERDCTREGENSSVYPFTLKMYADIINSFNLTSVIVRDPHSEVTPALINNCKVIPQEVGFVKWYNNFLFDPLDDRPVSIIAPDSGASKKAFKCYEAISEGHGIKGEIFFAVKSRDVSTGKLSKFTVPMLKDNTRYVIVDDICDGGRTFLGLKEEIDKQNLTNSNVSLYTTFGIYSQTLDPLVKSFYKVGCSDGFRSDPVVRYLNKEIVPSNFNVVS